MLDYVVRKDDTETETSDRAGVIVFGGEAEIEIAHRHVPPIDRPVRAVVDLHPEITSPESAPELAKALLKIQPQVCYRDRW